MIKIYKELKNTAFILDLSNYIYRCFFAIQKLNNSKGLTTNAIYGVTKQLKKLTNKFRPEYFIAACDSTGQKMRKEIYSEYKANRKRMDSDLYDQFDWIYKIVDAFGLQRVEQKKYEADDIIASYVKKFINLKVDVIIFSTDKDLLQLVDNKKSIFVFDPIKEVIYSNIQVKNKMGVYPYQMLDYLSIVGDSSDNIPGIPGIGEKTAIKLLNEFKTYENIIANKSKLSEKLQEKILNSKAYFLSQDLARLCDFLEVLEPEKYKGLDSQKLNELYKELEFKF